jgi:hypothetical protein
MQYALYPGNGVAAETGRMQPSHGHGGGAVSIITRSYFEIEALWCYAPHQVTSLNWQLPGHDKMSIACVRFLSPAKSDRTVNL